MQVRRVIGPIATPDVIHWAPGLPKTRSGKIMRRILRKIAAKKVGGADAFDCSRGVISRRGRAYNEVHPAQDSDKSNVGRGGKGQVGGVLRRTLQTVEARKVGGEEDISANRGSVYCGGQGGAGACCGGWVGWRGGAEPRTLWRD